MADEPVRKGEEVRREEHEHHEGRREEREPRETRREERRSRRGARQRETIVVDLGRKSRKDVRDLRKGRGPLMDDVEDCIEELRESGDISESTQPVVIIVERRWSSRGGMVPFLLPPGIPTMLPLSMGREDDDDDDDDDDED
jgi:hypothetical protein